MLMHQSIGLPAFNDLPLRKAMHALYECCNSVAIAGDLARSRPYRDHAALFARADALLFALSEESVNEIIQAYPSVGSRAGSARSLDHETERKVVRNEIARLNRTRLERMLGPEGGYDNWY